MSLTPDNPPNSAAAASVQPTPPAPARDIKQPDFLSAVKTAAQSATKQVYSGANQSAPGGPSPILGADGQPLPGNDQPQFNLDPDEKIKTEAKLWVFGMDMAASRGLKWYSKRGTIEQFKLIPSEKEELTNALADYFKTLPETPKMPPWVVLLLTALMIFGAKAILAHELRTTKPPEPKEEEEVEVTTKMVQMPGIVKRDRKPSKKKTRKQRLPSFDPSKPYWSQQYDRQGKLILNPVTESQNEQRKLKGGALCLNCKENTAAPGKNACSQHCSGKLKKKNVSSQ